MRGVTGYRVRVPLERAGMVALVLVLCLMATGCAPSLAVPPHLVSAWPAPSSTLPVTRQAFDLTFNRPLDAIHSWAMAWRDDDGSPLTVETAVDERAPRHLYVRLVEPAAGQYRLRWHAVTDASEAASDGEQVFVLQGEDISAPRLTVNRGAAESGDPIVLAGSGFEPRSEVRLTIGDDNAPLTTVQTTGTGEFSARANVPPGVPFGLQPITATDAEGAAATAALQVRWGGWPPLVAFTSGVAGPRSGEATFSVSLRNRSDYVLESVRILMDLPVDATYVSAEPVPTVTHDGLTWDVPLVDRGISGPFRATVRATRSDAQLATHTRIEFRHRRPRNCGDDCLPAFISETSSDSTPTSPAD